MKTSHLIIPTLFTLVPAIANANTITSDSPAWDGDTTVNIGGNFTQYHQLSPVTKSREVHVPSVPAYTYHNAHGQEIYVEEIPGYSYQEKYTAYEPATRQKYNANVSVSQKVGKDTLAIIGYDRLGYLGVSQRFNALTISTQVDTKVNLNTSAAYSPIKNTALLVNYNKYSDLSYGVQQQFGDTAVHALYSPAVKGFQIGIGYSFGNTPKTVTPTPPSTPYIAPTQNFPSAEPEPETVEQIHLDFDLPTFIRGRG